MRRPILTTVAVIAILVTGVAWVLDAEESDATKSQSQRTAQQEARQQRRAERLANYERFVDSLVLSHNYRFVPQTMQQMPAGIMRNLMNPSYEVVVWSDAVDVCIPFIKGFTPPYYPVLFNYVLPDVTGYTVEQTHDGWSVTFSTTMFSSTTYTFTFEIYSHYGGALLTISSPYYNSVQYSGNLLAI